MTGPAFQIGVAIIVWKDEHILVGKRLGAHGTNTWAPPGGMLEAGETPEACAARELFEETGLEAEYFRVIDAYPWDHRADGYNIVVACDWCGGKPETREPSKHAGWEWHRIADIPEPRYSLFVSWLARTRAK